MSINTILSNQLLLSELATIGQKSYPKFIGYQGGLAPTFSTTGTPVVYVSIALTGLNPGKPLLIFFSTGFRTTGGSRYNVIASLTGPGSGTTQLLSETATDSGQTFTFTNVFNINSSTSGSSQTLNFSVGVVNAVNWQTSVDSNNPDSYSIAVFEIQ